MSEIRQSEAQAIIDAMRKAGNVQSIVLPDGHVAVAIPEGLDVHDFTDAIDARQERLASGPRRIKGTEQAETLDSFIALVNRHKGPSTASFARAGACPKIIAVIDYHGEGDHDEALIDGGGPEPAWRGQRVGYSFPFGATFQEWRAGVARSKLDFIRFAEDRIGDFLDPDELPEPPPDGKTSLVHEVHDGVLRARGVPRIERSAKPLDSVFAGPARLLADVRKLKGISTQSVDEIEAGLGSLEITFTKGDKVQGAESVAEYYAISVEVFPGEERFIIPVRLRAQCSGGSLTLWFELIGLDRIVESAFLDACERVETETERPVYRAELAL